MFGPSTIRAILAEMRNSDADATVEDVVNAVLAPQGRPLESLSVEEVHELGDALEAEQLRRRRRLH